MTEPVKVMAPMATPSDISTRLARVDVAGHADAERARRIERGRRDQHRRHADQRMERRDQLRHRGHRHAPRDHRADAAADARCPTIDQEPRRRGSPGGCDGERGEDRDRHADHAEQVALPARSPGSTARAAPG